MAIAATEAAAGWVALALLSVLRALTFALGSISAAGSHSGRMQTVSAWLLGALACTSAALFYRSASRAAAEDRRWPFDAVTIWVETATGVSALLILANVTHAGQRPGLWAGPYTVISAVIIAAAARRAWAGAVAATCLAVAYLIGVLTPVAGPAATGPANTATAWTNAVSYLAFYALALMGFRLLRAIAGQAEALRLTLARLAAERTRISAADRIWQIGHDFAKALLREVRSAVLPVGTLRELAPRYRDDLLAALAGDPRAPADLRAELQRIAETYAIAVPLQVDLTEMTVQPTGIPALMIAEATRELLSNAWHHRSGYPAELTGSSGQDHVMIVVRNGGPGVNPRRLASSWALKRNILHQLETAGGSYHITSSPASDGTTVVLRYPASASGRTAPSLPSPRPANEAPSRRS